MPLLPEHLLPTYLRDKVARTTAEREALKALNVSGTGAFAPLFHDVRGDVYYAMGKLPEARSEYEQALNGEMAAAVLDPNYVTAKLDELGGKAADLTAATGVPGTVADGVPAQ